MPTKTELLQEAVTRHRRNKQRSGYEIEIAQAMPPNLDINRIYCGIPHTQPMSSCQGQVEIEVETFDEAIKLLDRPQLCPAPASKVTMKHPEQSYMPTISFYPDELVSDVWRRDHSVSHIYPVLLHVNPPSNRNGGAKVYLEWFTKIRDNLFASIRVYVKSHGYYYKKMTDENFYIVIGIPMGLYRIINSPSNVSPPFVSVYWCDDEKDDMSHDALRAVLANNGENGRVTK